MSGSEAVSGSLAERRARVELYDATLSLLQNLPEPVTGPDPFPSDGARRRRVADALRDLEPELSRLGSDPVTDLVDRIATVLARGAPHDRKDVVSVALLMADEVDQLSLTSSGPDGPNRT